MQTSAADLIDTRPFEFLSFAPPVGEQRLGLEEIRVSVEPDMGERLAAEIAFMRPIFPMRIGKIQRPCLPEETLPRERLFDWFDARKTHRAIYVTAEAGFGKTTLVADYLRRSVARIFWYRLDEEETDGLVFLRYLVAACQVVDTRLLSRASALLTEASIEPVRMEVVLETILSEMDALGEMPSAVVLDDFHVAETLPAIRSIVERLIARAPAGLMFVMASRRTPNLSVAAMRARGELAEIGREDLRFDEAETGRLFSEVYHHPLEPDVLHDLQLRTDGWAASLQLVKTAVDGRSPSKVRAFVRSLTGAEGNLHDYLAEEVVCDLNADLRDFLLRTSILEDIEPDTAAVAAGIPPSTARRLLADAQHLGLMSRGGDELSTWRPHPLVREFLLAHLNAVVGETGVAELHRRLAQVMESRNWRLSARHYASAGDAPDVRRVVSAATPTIIGTGDLAAADEFVTLYPDPEPNPWYDIIRARVSMAAGRLEEALRLTKRAEQVGRSLQVGDTSLANSCALNLLHLGLRLENEELLGGAARALLASDDPELASIARASELLAAACGGGSLDELCKELAETRRLSRERGHFRHEGISLVNLCFAELARGNGTSAATAAMAALALLTSAGWSADIAGAHVGAARGMAQSGNWAEAQVHIEAVVDDRAEWVEPDTIAEIAELHSMFGDPETGRRILDRALVCHPDWAEDSYLRQVMARLDLQLISSERAAATMATVGTHWLCPGFECAVRSLGLQIRASTLAPVDMTFSADMTECLHFAESQQAWFWWKNARLTQAIVSTAEQFSSYVGSLEPTDFWYLSIQAELVAGRLGDLDKRGFAAVAAEASLRPDRWRRPVRAVVGRSAGPALGAKRAVELLETIGETDDIAVLRTLAKRRVLRLPDAGRPLIRRLAPRVYVEDLGRVSVRVGERAIMGSDIRKKVLSLLCFLLTRPQYTATREQVFEALWPEMDPAGGANSLNQSAYFLRGILEPRYDEDRSPGYLRSRADLLWLDDELVNCRSADCLAQIAKIRRDPSPHLIARLADDYKARYALDFIYDDWASSFRETLHASYLERIERAIAHDIKAGAFERALSIAQLALTADPEADQIELFLLTLYRRMGATAAAAEQYTHYASVMREQLGVEPPPLDSI
jgi:DNA-binding SARP family transcriptional activator